jgi:hypothetical protein
MAVDRNGYTHGTDGKFTGHVGTDPDSSIMLDENGGALPPSVRRGEEIVATIPGDPNKFFDPADVSARIPDEEGAFGIFHALQKRFGWAGTVYNRQDASDAINRDLTDDEWARVSTSRAWANIPDAWGESASEGIQDILHDLDIDQDDDPYVDGGPVFGETTAEDRGILVLHDLRRRFGWTGTIYTRSDVEGELSRGLTDDEWQRVRDSKSWRNLSDCWAEDVWEQINGELLAAGIEERSFEEDDWKEQLANGDEVSDSDGNSWTIVGTPRRDEPDGSLMFEVVRPGSNEYRTLTEDEVF